eukprot:6115514-Prymnesium_polylepis.1
MPWASRWEARRGILQRRRVWKGRVPSSGAAGREPTRFETPRAGAAVPVGDERCAVLPAADEVAKDGLLDAQAQQLRGRNKNQPMWHTADPLHPA